MLEMTVRPHLLPLRRRPRRALRLRRQPIRGDAWVPRRFHVKRVPPQATRLRSSNTRGGRFFDCGPVRAQGSPDNCGSRTQTASGRSAWLTCVPKLLHCASEPGTAVTRRRCGGTSDARLSERHESELRYYVMASPFHVKRAVAPTSGMSAYCCHPGGRRRIGQRAELRPPNRNYTPSCRESRLGAAAPGFT